MNNLNYTLFVMIFMCALAIEWAKDFHLAAVEVQATVDLIKVTEDMNYLLCEQREVDPNNIDVRSTSMCKKLEEKVQSRHNLID